MIKNIVILLIRTFLIICSSIIEIKNNRIFVSSFAGKSFNCNPYYIVKYLINNEYNGEIIVQKNNGDICFNDIKVVRKHSLLYYYYFFSSKILITNDSFPSYMPKKKSQYLINTWHGGATYKTLTAKSLNMKIWYKFLYLNTDYFLSSCRNFTKVISKDLFVTSEKFLSSGTPRNDIFFWKEKIENANKKIREKYSLSNDECIILYAPTWRDDNRKIINEISEFDTLNKISKILNKKIKLLIRAHYNTKNLKVSNNSINVTDYPDMQELLCAADILITDYSSCMWDFSFMYKPCFIYATDVERYKQDRDFYTPMSKWPFPIATNTDELINNILNFDQKEYVKKVKQHHKDLGSFEDGHACERVCRLIQNIIDGTVKK